VLRGINRSGIAPGGTAVVQGAGSMGLLHLVVLRAALADMRVVMVDPAADRRAAAVTLGAAAAVAPGDAACDAVGAASGGRGADAVFDTVGGARTLEAALALTRQGGTVVLFAHAPVGDTAGFDLNDLFKHERRIIGTYSGALEEQRAIFDLMCSGVLDASPLVTHTMPLDDFQIGVDLVVARKALKVLFTASRKAGR
jgi:threonine dehydrogenase-like Zn-dependent dehydrogenase